MIITLLSKAMFSGHTYKRTFYEYIPGGGKSINFQNTKDVT